jgi:hypothetical protein
MLRAQENSSLFTRREVAQAKKARRLLRQLGYPSEADFIKLLTSSTMQ